MGIFIQLKVTQQMMVAELKNILLIVMLYMDSDYLHTSDKVKIEIKTLK